MSFTQVSLSPTPGFCIKSTTLEPGILPPTHERSQANIDSPSSSSPGGLLEPKPQPTPVPKGMKVFVNICYDKNVPPPPEGSEDAIQKAIKGSTPLEGEDGDEEEWYVPVVVSEPRLDNDKAGKLSLVVDCVYNSEVRSRTLRDPEFKIFLVELGIQRIEAQTGLTLSRNIGTPNIAAKGKLQPRTVRIPTALLNPPAKGSPSEDMPPALLVEKNGKAGSKKKGKEKEILDKGKVMADSEAVEGAAFKKSHLIEELGPPQSTSSAPAEKPKGILKQSSSATTTSTPAAATVKEQEKSQSDLMMPVDVSWSWEKLDSGRLQVIIHIPELTASSITTGKTYLDIEQRRIILTLSERSNKTVDIDRSLSDAQVTAKIHDRGKEKADVMVRLNKAIKSTKELEEIKAKIMADSEKEVTSMLLLKREKAFDVDGAKAQWFVKDKKLVITL